MSCLESEILYFYLSLFCRFDELEDMIKDIELKIDEIKSDVNDLQRTGQEKSEPSFNAEDIKNRLRENYRTSEATFFPVDWNDDCMKQLTDLYVQLELVDTEKLESSRQNSGPFNTCTIYDSFKPHQDCNFPERVLWVGDAGIGKTTSCKKLAVDFSENFDEFIETFPRTSLLIFLRCRDLEGQLLPNILELVLPQPVAEGREKLLQQWLKRNSSNLLFLIDGLDELSHPNKDLESLLQGNLFKGSRMIVTSRREGLKGRQRYFDSIFNIRGINESDVEQFASKYFQTFCKRRENVEITTKQFLTKLREDKYLHDLSQIPLCLLILCVIWEERRGILPVKMACLYHSFLNCMIDRYLAKYPEVTLREQEIRLYLINILSEVAYSTLKDNASYFEQRKLKRVIATVPGLNETDGVSLINRIGLVSIDKSGSKLCRCCYQFFHRSFQEFFCSLHIKRALHKSSPEELSNLTRQFSWLLELKVMEDCVISWSYPVLVRLLCGILRKGEFLALFSMKLQKIQKLDSCIWETIELFYFTSELDSERVNDLQCAKLIGYAFPSEVYLNDFKGQMVDVISGPLKHWASTNNNGSLVFRSGDLSRIILGHVIQLKALLLNQESKVNKITLELDSDSCILADTMKVIADIWWQCSSLTLMKIKFHSNRNTMPCNL